LLKDNIAKKSKRLFCRRKHYISIIKILVCNVWQNMCWVLNVVIKFLSLGIEPRSKILTTLALS